MTRKPSAYQQLTQKATTPRPISGLKYVGKEINGLKALLSFSAQAGGDPVAVETHDMDQIVSTDGTPLFHSYDTSLLYVKEAFLFPDGRVLICASVSEWGGTFQTHDNISVKYYTITPK